ncbi:phosphoglyceromutase [Cytophagaceae bacterium 50C-KIRBA]|uniref:Phosphoglyceromutase n=1 Tax=Aquirufa beregesia TaxID=2516556 RepID=A0ABX0EVK8_9BACT|nr:alkaline phosphatase family protein [Aquirufa beregesia]NGZ44605.1 phosphoglyceromutase [Aquirufa beregesia]
MRQIVLVVLVLLSHMEHSLAQKAEDNRVIVITTDGLRWQDVFKGMDSTLAKKKVYHHGDSLAIFTKFWDNDLALRRKKLMPFLWGELAQKGQIHGNRTLGNRVDVANPHWFSYPGYSELLTGQVDTAVNSNEYKPNPNTNFFEYLNQLPAYRNQVVAFGAWDAFDRILNEKRAGFPVINGYDVYPELHKDPQMKLISAMLNQSFRVFGDVESQDVFIHFQAMQYLKTKKPKAMYISYGETDEFAHEGAYQHYLQAVHHFDTWLKEIWDFVESDPLYKGKTTLLITTDHGRGDIIKDQWKSHGKKVQDSHEIWFAMLGARVASVGEVKQAAQIYQKDLIHLLAEKLQLKFKSERKE